MAASVLDVGMPRRRFVIRVALATASIALSVAGFAEPENSLPSRTVTPPAGTQRTPARVYRPRTPSSFFEQDAVRFQRAHVDWNGSVLADGHALQLFGAVLIPRNRICTSATGARWTCGQFAFMALRTLLDRKPITCSFKHISVPPKAVCSVGNSDIVQVLLGEGWAELAAGTTDAYVEASELAQSRGVGIWGDGPP
jgi:endonuclease YncB( thermonuclease family)